MKRNVKFVQTFFSYLAALGATLGHWQGGSITHLMFVTTLFQIRLEGHGKPRNEVGPKSMTERISGLQASNHQFHHEF